MEFVDQIKQIAQRAEGITCSIQTEEATKTALIMPFIAALGYDVFNPQEVTPEYTADIGTKKGEKIDYAILRDGTPVIFVECKWCGADLTQEHASQLFRYFATTSATRVGILTNGLVYQFYADLVEKNKMDEKPFFIFDIQSYDETALKELQKYTKTAFDADTIISSASDLKYTGEIKKILSDLLNDPEEEFVRYFTTRVYGGRFNAKVKAEFTAIVKKALGQFIRERINERLNAALDQEKKAENEAAVAIAEEAQASTPDKGITTTQEEIDGFNVVRAICCQAVDAQRIFIRDTKSYCGILFDDTNRKPICRLYFNSATRKYVGLFDTGNEEKVPVDSPSDLFSLSSRLLATASLYLDDSRDKKQDPKENGVSSQKTE